MQKVRISALPTSAEASSYRLVYYAHADKSFEAGFNNISSFIKDFKKYGGTPKEDAKNVK